MTRHFPPYVHELAPPQAKTRHAKPYRATRRPDVLPVPYIPLDPDYAASEGFAPDPPARGFFLWDELPRKKLRGLGPADSLILRHAIARAFFDPRNVLLAPLIPYRPPDFPALEQDPTRDLLQCPDAPLQPDFVDSEPIPMGKWRRAPLPEDPRVRRGAGGAARHLGPLVVEVKPNAGYAAVGQALAYHHAWMSLYRDDWPLRPAILTDLPRPYMHTLCRDYNIVLFTLGRLLVEPPPWPT